MSVHKVFALRPVKTQDRGWRWLTHVWRERHIPSTYIPWAPDPYWVYYAEDPRPPMIMVMDELADFEALTPEKFEEIQMILITDDLTRFRRKG